jgi:hypothetical protein
MDILTYEKFEVLTDSKRLQLSQSGEQIVKYTFTYNNRITIPLYIFLPDSLELQPKEHNAALFSVGMVLLPWLWTIYFCKKIVIRAGHLDDEQKQFWLNLFEGSLAEWFYLNSLPGWGYLDLVVEAPKNRRWRATTMSIPEDTKRVLVPLGGGKDSLVVQELLAQSSDKIDWQWFFLSGCERGEYQTNSNARSIASISGHPDVFLVDSDLTSLILAEATAGGAAYSRQGAGKGGFEDVTPPYMAFVAFTSALGCLLTGRNYIAVGNERSANVDNLTFNGHGVNHQYDKGFEFEQAVAGYIKKYICPDIHYFSALQHLWDLQVARIFAGNCRRYHRVFLSCNESVNIAIEEEKKALATRVTNASITVTKTSPKKQGKKKSTAFSATQLHCTAGATSSQYRNCGECEKCCFVWLVLRCVACVVRGIVGSKCCPVLNPQQIHTPCIY